MNQRLQFLKSLWMLFGSQKGEFPKIWVERFLAKEICNQLNSNITIADLFLLHGEDENIINQSIDRTIFILNRDWDLLLPEFKVELIKIIETFNLTEQFKGKLYLTDGDKEALKIRWDISDILYFAKKEKVFIECRNFGLDLEHNILIISNNSQEILDSCTKLIIELLKSKLEVDLATVSISIGASKTAKYTNQIDNRLTSEYLKILVNIRKTLTDFYTSHWEYNNYDASHATEKRLEPFKESFELLKSKTSKVQPNPEIYKQARELIGNNLTIGEIKMGDEYNIGQAGAVGPNSHAHNITFNQIWNQIGSSISLPTLASELSKLREILLKEAREPEQYTAIGNVASAESEAKKGEGAKSIEYLSKVSRWVLDTAIKVGVPVAIEVIKKALKLG